MPSRLTPLWALALVWGCSSETTTDTVELRQAEAVVPPRICAEAKLDNLSNPERYGSTEEGVLAMFDAAGLTNEEIWALGVSRFGWYPEEQPAGTTRESMAHLHYVDLEYGSYYDSPTFYSDVLGYDE